MSYPPEVPADALRQNQAIGNILLLVCWIAGHDNSLPEEGHWLNVCRRCHRYVMRAYWFQLIPYRVAKALVWLASKLDGCTPGFGYRSINNIEYIARSHLQSLVDQGDNMLLSDYLSDKGWVMLSDLKHDDGTPYTAQEQADLISKSLTLEATRQEQAELKRDD